MYGANVHPAALAPDELLRECDVRRVRRSGPGGQRRNKVETAVVLRHRSTGIEAEANERRRQAENQRIALFRLRINLALNVRCAVDPESPQSRLWQTRCRNGRIAVSPRHADFPSILAEALDVICSENVDLRAAADRLGCTSSQLTKLFRSEPRALTHLNTLRVERGLRRLK